MRTFTSAAGVAVASTRPVGVCVADRSSLQAAVDAFTTLEGHPPAAIADLVPTYLRTAPVGYQLDPSGQAVAMPGGPCTGT